MKLAAVAAALLAIGAGLGIYFVGGRFADRPLPSTKKAKRFVHMHTPDARIMFIPKAGP